MPSPNITLTCNFEALNGASKGSAIIQLQGYGTDLPRVSGTGIIPNVSEVVALGAGFNKVIWGNDQITPVNTTYLIKFYDMNGNFVASKSYSFTGGPKTVDLSTI